jgi:polyisoprenoid-binding protein YceI
MNRPSRLALSLSVASVLAVGAIADAKLTSSGASAVEFHASGPMGLKINGKSSVVQVDSDDKNVTITVPLSNLDTGMSLRNTHMKDKYLETSKYPNAVLVVPKTSAGYPNGGSGNASGNMTLHGVTKPVTFHYDVKKGTGEYAVSGTVHLNMTDFKIEEPSFAGAKVKPDVDVDISFHAKE